MAFGHFVAPITLQLWTAAFRRGGSAHTHVGRGMTMPRRHPSSSSLRCSSALECIVCVCSCRAWPLFPGSFCRSLGLPSPSPLRPPHLCSMECCTHPRQRSKPCNEKPPTLHICRTSDIVAREPRKARHFPHMYHICGRRNSTEFRPAF
jgi:hypothetical protein